MTPYEVRKIADEVVTERGPGCIGALVIVVLFSLMCWTLLTLVARVERIENRLGFNHPFSWTEVTKLVDELKQ